MHKESSNISLPEPEPTWMLTGMDVLLLGHIDSELFIYHLDKNHLYYLRFHSHLYNYINLVNQGLRPEGALFRPQLCALAQKDTYKHQNNTCKHQQYLPCHHQQRSQTTSDGVIWAQGMSFSFFYAVSDILTSIFQVWGGSRREGERAVMTGPKWRVWRHLGPRYVFFLNLYIVFNLLESPGSFLELPEPCFEPWTPFWTQARFRMPRPVFYAPGPHFEPQTRFWMPGPLFYPPDPFLTLETLLSIPRPHFDP